MIFYEKYNSLLSLNHSQYDVIALTGGRGSTKTGHTIRGVLKCLIEKKKRACFFRETKETIEESSKAEIDSIIDADFKNRGFVSKKEKIQHINGSYIFFKGLREVNQASIENLKGIATNTDYFIVDEAQAVSKPVWDALIPTLRKAGSVLIVIYNRIKDKLPVEEALFLDYSNMTAPIGTYFIEVNYPEIQTLGFLSDVFIKRAELLRDNKPDEYAVKYLNKVPDTSKTAVVKYFSSENINDKIRYNEDLDIHLSMDFNVDPMMWCLSHKTETKFFVFDEIAIENCTTQDAIDEFIARYPNHKGEIVLNGDSSGAYRKTQSKYTDYAIIKNALIRYGYKVRIEIRHSNVRVKNRIQAFNRLVYDDSGERRWFVHPRCKWLIHNMKNLKYKEGTSVIDEPTPQKIKTDPEAKFLGHIFDAASYPVEYYYPVIME